MTWLCRDSRAVCLHCVWQGVLLCNCVSGAVNVLRHPIALPLFCCSEASECCAIITYCAHRFEGAEEAWSILSKGPEPLTSQFTTSYGLVLNLLSVYTLEEAREFLARWVMALVACAYSS